MTRPGDALLRFSFAGVPARGAIVCLGDTWRAVRGRNAAAHNVEQILGEALAASSLLLSGVKIEARLSLQLQADGPLRLLVAQCSSDGAQRGIVHCDPAASERWDFSQLDADAVLMILIDGLDSEQHYQGIVPLAGTTLAAALETYFRQSEQLDTRVWLNADHQRAAGLILQRLPGAPIDGDGWNRITMLANTVTAEEMLALPVETLLARLFHQETMLDSGSLELRFECQCSRERVVQVLRLIGREELMAQLEAEAEIVVDCEFCNQRYRFDPVDVEQLFATAIPRPPAGGLQ